jgi:hypothetical protein
MLGIRLRVSHNTGEAGITCHPVATEQANSMGIGKRIHSPLRRTYLKLRQEHPNMSKDLLLDAAVKAHNDTSGVNGLVPTLLVYGSFPRLPIRDENIDSPSNSERASTRSLAMAGYSKAIDELRSSSPKTHNRRLSRLDCARMIWS